MKGYNDLDIYARRRRNRMRLAAAVAAFTLISAAVSTLAIYMLYWATDIDFNPWVVILLFWLIISIYGILRYALGGRWVFRSVRTLPPLQEKRRLQNALDAARLAAGMEEKVRLLVMPSRDINTFSLSLPDGSYALFATSGIADKLSQQEREAIMAHEIAHMESGDTLLYTVMLRLTGQLAFRKKFKHQGNRGSSLFVWVAVLLVAFSLVSLFLIYVTAHSLDREMYSGYFKFDLWLPVVILFVAVSLALPYVLKMLLRLSLDREREYNADMQAAYFMRDPACVYNAVKSAADDVSDVLLLPASLDALLFHPVVDYSSYAPFRTQPTMPERMQRLEDAFPRVDLAHCASDT